MSNTNPFGNQGQPNYANQQPQFQKPKSNGMMIVIIVVAVAFVPMMGCCIGLLLPAVQAAREAARRMSCQQQFTQIGLALQNYHTVHKSLPPAYTVDAQGRKLHSWRTLILPYLEQKSVYDQIDLNKPWDDPANQSVASIVIPTYQCPSTVIDPTMTTFVAVVDPSGIMSGPTPTRYREVLDGLANTLVVIEADSANAVHWMSPDDVGMQQFLNRGGGRNDGGHLGGSHVMMADGTVVFMTDSVDSNLAQALVTKDKKDAVNFSP